MNVDETAQRILAELEEARVENVTSTLNTVFEVHGDSRELDDMFRSLKQLIDFELVILREHVDGYARVETLDKLGSLARLHALKAQIVFDSDEQIWIQLKDTKRAAIYALDAGMTEAQRILDERGYQWWRPRTRKSQ